MNKIGIYVHIPFCKSKCNYCNFISKSASDEEKSCYFDALLKEIKSKKALGCVVTTIYIGGGTPSVVDSKYILQILDAIRSNFNIIKNAEISIECNPNSVDCDKLKTYKDAGINRISFGVQSIYKKDLEKLNRYNGDAIKAIKLAKSVGIDNINADLLLGLEKQNFIKVKHELSKLIRAGVKHLSCYMLINEEGTKLNGLIKDKKYLPLDEGKTVKIYNKVYSYLKHKKFNRYEVSNFAKKGYECKHNINTWKCNEYLGFGQASHSFFDNLRYSNSENIEEYLKGQGITKHNLTKRERAEEFIMLGLRLNGGINLKEYKTKFKEDLLEIRKDEIDELLSGGFITIQGNYLKVKNFGILNLIIVKLI